MSCSICNLFAMANAIGTDEIDSVIKSYKSNWSNRTQLLVTTTYPKMIIIVDSIHTPGVSVTNRVDRQHTKMSNLIHQYAAEQGIHKYHIAQSVNVTNDSTSDHLNHLYLTLMRE